MNNVKTSIAYNTFGAGDRDAVLLHGFGGFKEMWGWQLNELGSLAQLVLPDLPGHGDSDWQDEDLSDMAEEVSAILDREDIGRAHFVGSSFGGLVALKFWEKFPDRVLKLSFVGSVPRFTSDVDYPATLNSEKIQKLARQLNGDMSSVLDMFYRSLFTRFERDSLQYGLIKGLRKQAKLPRLEALLSMLDMLETTDLRHVLRRVNVPVQFILGDSDDLCPRTLIPSLQAICPSGSFSEIDDGGHFPFMSWPDDVNRLLVEFMQA